MEICLSRNLKCIVYNADNAQLAEAVAGSCKEAERIGVGFTAGEVKILEVSVSLDEEGASTSASYELAGERVKAKAALFGEQHSYNIGYALTAGKYFGIETIVITAELKGFKQLSGRGAIKRIGNSSWLVDEAYNASPKAMGSAIANVLNIVKDHDYDLYAVLGGMGEMGESSAYWHNKIAGKLDGFKQIFLYGAEWADEGVKIPENALYCKTMEELIGLLLSLKLDNSVVLVKGSNVYGLKRIVTLLTEGTNVL